MPIPVVISTNGFVLPVRQVDGGAPVMQVAAIGIPIVLSDLGVPMVVLGGEPLPDVAPAMSGGSLEVE